MKITRHKRVKTGAASVVGLNRPIFEKVKTAMNEIFAGLDDRQKASLIDPKTHVGELKLIVVESLKRVLGPAEAVKFLKSGKPSPSL